MSKNPNQKLKLLYLYQILLQRTDENPVSYTHLDVYKRQKLNGSWSAELVTAAEQEGLAAMYGRVPLVCVDSLSQRAGSWNIICADTPNAYTELLWSVESAMGDLDEAVRLQPTTVTQSVLSLIHI